MLLASFHRVADVGRFGPDGTVELELSRRPAGRWEDVDGVFTTAADGTMVALYRRDDRLWLQVDEDSWPVDRLTVGHRLVDGRSILTVGRPDGPVDIDLGPPPAPPIDPALDPTPSVGPEDGDFGRFVAAVLGDPGRGERVFRHAPHHPDVTRLDAPAALALVDGTDWVAELSGDRRDWALASVRALVRYPNTAVISAATAAMLATGHPDLVDHVLDVLAASARPDSGEEEAADVILDAMVRAEGGGIAISALLADAAGRARAGRAAAPRVEAGADLAIDWLGGRPATADQDGPYRRAGPGPYFEIEVADTWPERWWGLWGFAMERLGWPVEEATVDRFRQPGADAALRSEVAAYLDRAPLAVIGQQPRVPCRWCDEQVDGAAYRSDGVWLWPDDLAHLVMVHDFVVPNRLVDHIRAAGEPPATLGVDPADLPWPA